MGYQNHTTWDILNHLYTKYANISSTDLRNNDKVTKTAYDTNQSIEVLIEQIEDAVEFAAAGSTPYTAEQVVNISYQLIYEIGMFADNCKLWKRNPDVDKTWTAFKQYFSLAHQGLRKAQVGTTDTLFGSANASITQDTVDAIANLATATAHDRVTLSTLTTTNALLTLALTKANADLVEALKTITYITKKLGEREKTIGPATFYSRPTNTHDCFTYGHKSSHSSLKCTAPGPGH